MLNRVDIDTSKVGWGFCFYCVNMGFFMRMFAFMYAWVYVFFFYVRVPFAASTLALLKLFWREGDGVRRGFCDYRLRVKCVTSDKAYKTTSR